MTPIFERCHSCIHCRHCNYRSCCRFYITILTNSNTKEAFINSFEYINNIWSYQLFELNVLKPDNKSMKRLCKQKSSLLDGVYLKFRNITPLLEMAAARTLRVLRDLKRRSIFNKSWGLLCCMIMHKTVHQSGEVAGAAETSSSFTSRGSGVQQNQDRQENCLHVKEEHDLNKARLTVVLQNISKFYFYFLLICIIE